MPSPRKCHHPPLGRPKERTDTHGQAPSSAPPVIPIHPAELADCPGRDYSSPMRTLTALLPLLGTLCLTACESKESTTEAPEKSAESTESASAASAPDKLHQSADKSQTYAEAIQLICDAPNAPDVKGSAPEEQSRRIAEHVQAHVTHKRAAMGFRSLADIAPQERFLVLRDFAKEAKIEPCALLSEYPAPDAQSPPELAAAEVPTEADESATPTTAEAAGEEAELEIPFEKHYVGKHKLGVNRVNDGKRNGRARIFREANALVLEAGVKKGKFSLELAGIVKPLSKEEFVLDGTLSGVPDMTWDNQAPTEHQTKGQFTFRATKGRKFWRLYEVNGVDCVCDDNCGNEFCYIDLSF